MKQKDKEEAGEKTLVACMDLQGLLLRPALQAPARYYQTKLSVHNLTIFDMASHDATHYLWHEGEAGMRVKLASLPTSLLYASCTAATRTETRS